MSDKIRLRSLSTRAKNRAAGAWIATFIGAACLATGLWLRRPHAAFPSPDFSDESNWAALPTRGDAPDILPALYGWASRMRWYGWAGAIGQPIN